MSTPPLEGLVAVRTNLAISAALVAVLALALALTLGLSRPESSADPSDNADSGDGAGSTTSSEAPLVREDSHVVTQADSADAPTLVEFLDFECEACASAYPVVEQIREDYAGQINVVVRYFPIQSHVNAVNAAVAVEAASQQGQFEAMYSRMYETQAQWGEKQTSEAATFRDFAQDLGLDMADYDAAVGASATLARVEQDYQDGLDLGVQGTPTFFLDGELLEPTSVEDFRGAIDDALTD
ncbi:MAG: thioredoxin domain-containing protein [Ornithinimicrobium sp.]